MPEDISAAILVVDEREEDRHITARTLRNAGYSIVEACSGREALTKAAELPDLVLLDVRLPDMTGYEVCKRIKANPITRGIPVVHLSASFVTSDSKVMSPEGGADSYLTHPVEPPVLLATVKALLQLRKAEALSRLSARQWQATFDLLLEAIGLLDQQGQVRRCNRAMSELVHRRYSEIEGQPLSGVLAESLGVNVPAAGDNTKWHRMEVESRDRRWFVISTDPIVDQDGNPAGTIFVVSDVTGSKRAEEALKMSERLAATGRLAHSIAHEINNPLEAVGNLLYLMDQKCTNGELKRYLEQATAELGRASRITKQTLAFHREATSPMELNIADLVDSVLSLHGPQLMARKISVRRQYDSKTIIAGLPAALQQAISNILSNAIEVSRAGDEITLRVSHSHTWRAVQSGGVRILVADQGRGIPPELRPRIFDAFFTTKGTKGSGLGLWLTLGIVHKHGGQVRLRSSVAPGRSGTCFSIFLPYHPAVQQNNAYR